MSFIFIAIISYFFTACASVFDKFLISSKKITHPVTYTFYLGFFSVFTLIIFFPFGFHLIDLGSMLGMFLFSAFYALGVLMLFFSFQRNEVSRVVPVVGVFVTLTSLLISLFFWGDVFMISKLFGVSLLIIGSVTISLKFSKNNLVRIFDGFLLAIFSGFFMGIGFSGFKYFYNQDNFFNVFIWTRIGIFLTALTLLLIPVWRREIIKSLNKFKKSKKKRRNTGFLFVGNKILGGLGSILINLAFSGGSVAIVNALVATEYVFIFLISSLLAFKFPNVLEEKRDSKIVFQKIVAIIIIGIGIFLVK